MTAVSEKSKPHRRWFQFSLGSLFLLVSAVSVALAWIGHQRDQVRRRDDAIWSIEARVGVHLANGRAAASKLDFVKAITEFDATLKLDSNCVEAYHRRGNAWQELGQFDKAIADYDAA